MRVNSRILPGFLGLMICGGFLCWWSFSEPEIEDLIKQATTAIEKQNGPLAFATTRQILERDPKNANGLFLSAVLSAENADYAEAIDYCRRVSAESNTIFVDARVMAGNISLEKLGLVSAAEAFFREALSKSPDHLVANERLVYLLSLQTRSWDLIPYQLRVLRQSPEAATKIQLLMQGELAYPDEKYVQQLQRTDRDCAGLALARAHIRLLEKEYAEAKRFCKRAISLQADFPEAHAKLGQILLQIGSEKELLAWQSVLPASAWNHPGVLDTAGQFAWRLHDEKRAARCFWESLRLDPNSAAANLHLGQSLVRLGRSSEAQAFLERSADLERYDRLLDSKGESGSSAVLNTSNTFDEFLQNTLVAKNSAESLGLYWDAYSWSLIAAQAPEPPAWVKPSIQSLLTMLPNLSLVRTESASNPATHIDLSELPYPRDVTQTSGDLSSTANHRAVESSISFSDEAERVGLRFQYDNGMPQPRNAQIRPYDFTGGGVAIVDVNTDGRPDVFLTQGSRTLPGTIESDDADATDSLFLNRQGTHFSNISDVALSPSADYSQGASAGDLDNDGFADLLIANLGKNRLLRNNGDGTFSDITSAIDGDRNDWTTSCLICDLNQDSHPDLYFVNYLGGEVLTKICSDDERRYGGCSPRDFPAAQDQVFINDGMGQFRDITADSGIRIPDGKGLGVIAADFNADRRIDLFVANDGVPNFLFENVTEPTSSDLRFNESAMANGVACNGDGQSEACMGVVFEDLNQDGFSDLFVTNFMDEKNTLYRSTGTAGLFEDATSSFGLILPSLRMLGFGTQAIDADLDGFPELAVSNGHVDSYPERDVAYRMPGQVFRNINGHYFQEIPSGTLGEYFTRQHLGRSMARMDWNQDGVEDLVVSHLDEPVALLTNQTPRRGRFLALRLVATTFAREAPGTIVTIKTSRGVLTRQLTMGDGYQASNERQLIFGIGSESVVQELTVQWPSGNVTTVPEIATDACGTIIEGRNSIYLPPR